MVEIRHADGILYELLLQIQRPPLNTLVHVGAHMGQEIPWYEHLAPKRVVWIEGDPAMIPVLRNSIAERGSDRVEHVVVEALITDTEGEPSRLHRFSNEGMSSSVFRETDLLKQLAAHVHSTGEVHETRSRTLASVLREVGVKPEELDALVVDIQGAELMCLRGAGEYLTATKFLEVEVSTVPIYEGAPLFPELNALITGNGLRLITPVPINHGDVVYANPRFVQFQG